MSYENKSFLQLLYNIAFLISELCILQNYIKTKNIIDFTIKTTAEKILCVNPAKSVLLHLIKILIEHFNFVDKVPLFPLVAQTTISKLLFITKHMNSIFYYKVDQTCLLTRE